MTITAHQPTVARIITRHAFHHTKLLTSSDTPSSCRSQQAVGLVEDLQDSETWHSQQPHYGTEAVKKAITSVTNGRLPSLDLPKVDFPTVQLPSFSSSALPSVSLPEWKDGFSIVAVQESATQAFQVRKILRQIARWMS